MKKRTMVAAVLSLAAVSAAWAFQSDGDEDEQEEKVVKLADTPALVQTALKKAAGGAQIDEIEMEGDGGVTVYEASWKVDGVEHEVSVDAAGQVLETERTVSRENVPDAVRKAASQHMPADAMLEFELKSVMLYSVAAMVDGKEVELLIDPAGRLMELEADDDGPQDDDQDGDEDDDDEDEDDE